MAIVAKYNEGSTQYTVTWKEGDPHPGLEHIQIHGHSCWEIFADGDEFQKILHYSRGIPNLSNLQDESMYFAGDWSKMIALNICNIFGRD
jgi:hypothetical protein